MGSTKIINFFILIIIIMTIIIEHSNTDGEIEFFGKMNINYNGRDAFIYVYNHLSYRYTKGNGKDILRRYLLDLYNTVTLNLNDKIWLTPLDWCLRNVASLGLIKQDNQEMSVCKDYLQTAGYDSDGNARKALFYTYFETTTTATKMNVVGSEYANYMLSIISRHIAELDSMGPQQYCNNIVNRPIQYYTDHYESNPVNMRRESYHYADCINLMTSYGFDIVMNGADAFEYAYLRFSTQTTKGLRNAFLRQYLNDLFATAISKFTNDMLQNSINWCVKYILENKEVDINYIMNTCNAIMCRSHFTNNTKEDLKYAYFYLVETRSNMHSIAKLYYTYMINTFKLFIDHKFVKGPNSYCEDTFTSNTSRNDQRSTSVPFQLFDDQQQPTVQSMQQLSNNPNVQPSSSSSIPTQNIRFSFDLNCEPPDSDDQ